jgi:hypothetical protein
MLRNTLIAAAAFAALAGLSGQAFAQSSTDNGSTQTTTAPSTGTPPAQGDQSGTSTSDQQTPPSQPAPAPAPDTSSQPH